MTPDDAKEAKAGSCAAATAELGRGAASMVPRGDETSGVFQDRRLRAERQGIERGDRRRHEIVAPFPRRINAERGNQRCFIAAGVLARALAERQPVGFDIENIVGHLKRRAKRAAITGERGPRRVGSPRIAPASTA